ncbi:nucleotidyltransferase family protein [Fumia xinanensis]|uniref:Nucleotidyltransferase family protein n=1 Tax=Fumia xinanensis TaxID=2763659 RepID=A0A926I787_9FIRM|nr:nucleotidyltransferase family protein [Fumia xinanensis]MBC8560715.1 nucleotidyltransferase family protein [Fumia xinanensis]
MNHDFILEKIQKLVKENISCPELIPLLERHKCLYLRHLTGDAKVNMDIQLAKAAAATRYQVCAPVFAEIHQIPYAAIKGAVLSQDAYGSPFFRASGDIDTLTSREYVDVIKSIFQKHGFIQGKVTDGGIVPYSRKELLFQTAMSHQTAPFIKKASNPLCPYVNVDVNLDIMWGESAQNTDMEYVLSHSIEMEIAGITVKRLAPEMAFLSLCLHHYKDMNSIYLLYEGSLRLSLFCDIYYYTVRNLHLDWKLLRQHSEALSVGSYLYYCLYYTNQIFDDPSLTNLLKMWEVYRDDHLLGSLRLTDAERKTWSVPFPERLFTENISKLMDGILDDADRKKIALNKCLM